MNSSTVVTESTVANEMSSTYWSKFFYILWSHTLFGMVDDKASVCKVHIEGFKQDW